MTIPFRPLRSFGFNERNHGCYEILRIKKRCDGWSAKEGERAAKNEITELESNVRLIKAR